MNRSEPLAVARMNWRVDDDGMLRVTANVLREGVFPYRPDADYPPELAGRDRVLEFVSRRQFTPEALATLEGKPVVVGDHAMLCAGAEEGGEPAATRKVGAVAGRPAVTDDGFVRVDFLISDPETIRRVQERDLIEVSAGYRSLVVVAPGRFGGRDYDGEQTDLRFNHILILPYGTGRCGREVRIINRKEEANMTTKISRAVGEGRRDYHFETEDDARTAERMARDGEEAVARTFADRVNAMEDAAAEKDRENEELAAAKADLEERLTVLEKAVEELLYLKRNEQADQEEAIVAEELGDDGGREADAAGKDLDKANSLEERRAAVVRRVARLNGIDADAWSQDQIDANFAMLAVRAGKSARRRRDAARSSRVDGARTNAGSGSRGDARARLAAYHARVKSE